MVLKSARFCFQVVYNTQTFDFFEMFSRSVIEKKINKSIPTCRVPLDDTVSLATVAHLTPGYVGADLNALVREAAKCAVNRIFDNLVKREKTDSFKRLTKQQTKEELDKGE